jgi:hypothetical protein
MLTFLDHKDVWKGESIFDHADILPYWRKREDLPHVPVAVDDVCLRVLARLIRTYLHRTGVGATPA